MRSFDFSPLFRSTVGFDRMFDMLDQVADTSQGYPPYNIERLADSQYRITVAVAGFGDKDLNIEVRDGVLSVAGKREDAEKQSYLHHGIAGRAFERRFQLAEHVEVKGAKLENGLLHVDLERVVPEEKKPRRIAINGQTNAQSNGLGAPELKTIEGSAKAA
ncbi:MAG: Hsp20 family protein [Alphaproteobacteria bacterium]|nr:Hsp20 family protein [Alphaproteobacteria bacterium]